MPEDTHQIEMLQLELAEALNDVERYERVARGDYTPAELKDKGDPIQKLALTYESLKSSQNDLRQLMFRYDQVVVENGKLRIQLAEASRNAKKPKGKKEEESPSLTPAIKEDKLHQMFKVMKNRVSDATFTYSTEVTPTTDWTNGRMYSIDIPRLEFGVPHDPNDDIAEDADE